MKKIVLLCVFVAASLGCARVRVEAPKEAIKLDITMRLDVYQHVQKDIDAIEGIVSGSPKADKLPQKQTLLDNLISEAYAQESLSPEVESAALRRKNRRPELLTWEAKGVIGENRSGLVDIRKPGSDAAQSLAREENSDRMVIYSALANKNNVSTAEIQRVYAKRLQETAPSGTPVEALNQSTGGYEWQVK
ncbi:MAG: DUF1318 domain-containing protein [Candidatus Omnitrophica bacterium]|nr:DUF1318 domain-containing protein [Candidatus Omnitrophota bacterium]